MKAAVMEAEGEPLAIRDLPEPQCPPGGAIVRVEAS
jgi:NADPH:quinone reductase-like Zn-dependent oxidoreductase